jgi:hypothetical protein
MKFLRLLLIVGVAACGIQYWHQHHFADASASVMPVADQNGFMHMPPVEGQSRDTVYIVTTRHCPRRAVRSAVRLARDLSDAGIAVVRTHSVIFLPVGLLAMDDSEVNRVTAMMNGPSPIVFVHGKAKTAATLEDVEAELGPAK